MQITLATDAGPECPVAGCGSTIYGYTVWSDGYVSFRCAGCHDTGVFHIRDISPLVDHPGWVYEELPHVREVRQHHEGWVARRVAADKLALRAKKKT